MARSNPVGNLELSEVLTAPLPPNLEAPELPENLDRNRIITAGSLLRILSETVEVDLSSVSTADIDNTAPKVIEYGLYIPKEDPRFRKSKHTYEEVVFPVEQWLEIARSPSDLARHMYSRTQKVNAKRPPETRVDDRDVMHATAMRAGGHTLEERLVKLDGLYNSTFDELDALRRLHTELKFWFQARYRAENLDVLRKVGHNAIHRAAEVSVVNTKKKNVDVDGIHRAIHYKLYGPQSTSNRRVKNWRQFTYLAGTYAKRRIDAIITSMHATEASLDEYGPFLDTKREAKASEVDEQG